MENTSDIWMTLMTSCEHWSHLDNITSNMWTIYHDTYNVGMTLLIIK